MPTVFIPKETAPDETRVAITPDLVKHYTRLGLTVTVEHNAGEHSFFDGAAYEKAGATTVQDSRQGSGRADLTLMINPPSPDQIDALNEGAGIISLLFPVQNSDRVQKLADRKISAFAMDAIPRITRAQKHDALSSQSNLAGYKAVLLAAEHCPKIFPMMMTAAGTIRPAHVVVIGAGVAGLQAIATAKRLGAVVEVSDVRPAVKEQVQSLGATYIEIKSDEDLATAGGYAKEASKDFMKRQQEVLREHLIKADCIITTALIPGKPAPRIIPADIVEAMRPGSVIVDMAVEQGGNCELSEPGQVVEKHGVKLVGIKNLPATMPVNASELYSKNVYNVVADIVKDKQIVWDLGDEVVDGALVTHQGEIRHAPTREALGLPPLQKQETVAE